MFFQSNPLPFFRLLLHKSVVKLAQFAPSSEPTRYLCWAIQAWPGRKEESKKRNNVANLAVEQNMWQGADNLAGHMDVPEYKHVEQHVF